MMSYDKESILTDLYNLDQYDPNLSSHNMNEALKPQTTAADRKFAIIWRQTRLEISGKLTAVRQ